jgi:hypothetical protein
VTTKDGNTANLYYVFSANGEAVNYHPRTLAEVYVEDHSVVDDMMDSLTIGELVHYTQDSGEKHSLFDTISTWTVKDLQNKDKIQALTVGDILEIADGDVILNSLKDTPISGLNNAIHTLELQKIIPVATLESNMFLKHLKTSSIDTLATDIEKLSVKQIFADQLTSPTGVWKYVATDDGNGNDYTIKDMDKMIGSVTEKIKTATIGNLATDGIISVDTNFLNKEIIYTINIAGMQKTVANSDDFGGKTTIAQMTITELSSYMVNLFNVINEFQNAHA